MNVQVFILFYLALPGGGLVMLEYTESRGFDQHQFGGVAHNLFVLRLDNAGLGLKKESDLGAFTGGRDFVMGDRSA